MINLFFAINIILILYNKLLFKMGGNCESCTTADDEYKNTLVLNPQEDYSLQPEDFYNQTTKEIAMKIGPFKYNDEDLPQFIEKGPITL